MKKKNLSDFAYYGLMVLFVLMSVWLHFAAGDTFPVPWPDEAVFVQQATAFQQHGTLFSPQLNPARDVFWMPPGYMVLLGIFFKLVGSGLYTARLFSLLLTVSVFILIALLLKNEHARFFFLVLVGLFFLDKYFIITGNIARMESLLLVGVVGAMVLLDRGESWKATILLVVLGLIHPNAAYFVFVGFFYVFLQKYFLGDNLKATRVDRLFLVIAGVLLATYLIYAALHWGAFISDMSYQFGRKGSRYLVGPFASWSSRVTLFLAFIALILSLMQKNRRLIIFSLFAGASWAVNKIGQELWYQVFDALAYLLISVVVIELLNPGRRKMQYAILFLLAVFISAGIGMIENPEGYPYSMKWVDMRMERGVRYFTAEDKSTIGRLLAEHQKESQLLRVQFFPHADALFFGDMEGRSIMSIYPASPLSVFPPQQRDLFLVHISRYLPPGWRGTTLPWILDDAAIDTTDKRFLLFQRDSTERWYYRFSDQSNDLGRGKLPDTTRGN
jgi:hypothetical protein